MILTSKSNPLIKSAAALKEKKGRKEQGAFLVEGRKMAAECAASPLSVEHIFVAESYDGETPRCGAEITRVSDDVLRYLSDEKTPQGILCRVAIPRRQILPPSKSCLFLDGVADPGNVGTILRTANAAGYEEIYLTDTCADPYSPKCVRASMSGIFFTKLYRGSREELLSALGDVPLIAADMSGENVFSFRPPEKFALAIGNEANGISEETFRRARYTVRIPMQATQESLNAAISAGILMYELKRETFD